jgi:hypothetical protein
MAGDHYSIPQPASVRRAPGTQGSATTGSGPGASFLGSDMRGPTLTAKGHSVGLVEYAGTDLADLKCSPGPSSNGFCGQSPCAWLSGSVHVGCLSAISNGRAENRVIY